MSKLLQPLRDQADQSVQIVMAQAAKLGGVVGVEIIGATWMSAFDDGLRIALEDPELARQIIARIDGDIFPGDQVADRASMRLLDELRAAAKAELS